MYARFLDMLENRTDENTLSVAEGIDIAFGRRLEKRIEIDGGVGCDTSGLGHIALEIMLVVGDDHATSAKHVAWTHE